MTDIVKDFVIIIAGISIAFDIGCISQSLRSIANSLERTATPILIQGVKDAIRSVK